MEERDVEGWGRGLTCSGDNHHRNGLAWGASTAIGPLADVVPKPVSGEFKAVRTWQRPWRQRQDEWLLAAW